MKFSATTSGANTRTNLECRGAGRAAKLTTIADCTTGISQAADTTPQDGTTAIVDRSATHATFYDMVNSGYSDTSWIESTAKTLHSESSTTLKMDGHGIPQNDLTWSVIIEQHLARKSPACSYEVHQLRRERLLLLAGVTISPKRTSLETVQKRLYELTENEVYNVYR
jgi:hypothetical protein